MLLSAEFETSSAERGKFLNVHLKSEFNDMYIHKICTYEQQSLKANHHLVQSGVILRTL